jgi:hypothetical protein
VKGVIHGPERREHVVDLESKGHTSEPDWNSTGRRSAAAECHLRSGRVDASFPEREKRFSVKYTDCHNRDISNINDPIGPGRVTICHANPDESRGFERSHWIQAGERIDITLRRRHSSTCCDAHCLADYRAYRSRRTARWLRTLDTDTDTDGHPCNGKRVRVGR